MAYLYPISLAFLSAAVMLAERLVPWRKEQRQLRPAFGSDLLHLIFNGHFLGVILFGLYANLAHPWVVQALEGLGVAPYVYVEAAKAWPIWVQIPVALVVVDFVQWCVHNALHRVPMLWQFHKVHHSVKDDEMDWIVSFRFHWMEVVIYKSVQYLPLAYFGFGFEAVMFHAVFGTLIGHLNHSNLDLSWGPLRYVFNSPRMHIWHHDYDREGHDTVNFGIIFSIWDWLFRTAHMPDAPPRRLGFRGEEELPMHFLAHAVYPAVRGRSEQRAGLASAFGAVLLGSLFWLSQQTPPGPGERGLAVAAPREPGASSQPAKVTVASLLKHGDEADKALSHFGSDAKERGYAHPEYMVSVGEVKDALGAERLVLIDVRPKQRFDDGHIPTAQNLDRKDYEVKEPVPGVSRSKAELEAALRRVGARHDSVVVLYGDGGPEPYRLWWTLREVAGYDSRVLDGGLLAWKERSLPTSAQVEPARTGNVVLAGPKDPPRLSWQDVEALLAGGQHSVLLDTRSHAEYLGEEQHKGAARAGRIPGALHMDWLELLRSKSPSGDSRLLPVAELRESFRRFGVEPSTLVVTHCQTGTRSSVTYFALLQLGEPEERLLNYDGSWAEYSRSDLPIEVGLPPVD